jgi:pimeloyl-ACP methyl ester carboxylesterase
LIVYFVQPEFGLAHHEDSLVFDRIGELKCPILLIVGANDTPFVNAASFLKNKLSNSELRIVADAGHLLVTTHKQQVAHLISQWLNKIQ